MIVNNVDKIIIGAGFYGLYSALLCGKKGQSVLVIEKEDEAFTRASYANQARIHMGYHYPRSISTAKRSAGYFNRFCEDFGFCIRKDFEQIYATSSCFSWTNASDFIRFCGNADIPCSRMDLNEIFKKGTCDGAFRTIEYSYDAQILKGWILNEINKLPNIQIEYAHFPERIERNGDVWVIDAQELKIQTPFILNATYAAVNEVLKITEGGVFPPFKIKYEKCEIILCNVNDRLKNLGITVMDGPFFSLMPFGKTGLHSLTSVTFTPHETCYESIASFLCQKELLIDESDDIERINTCIPGKLGNCNNCSYKPNTEWVYMSQLARKYLKEEYAFNYYGNLFSLKPILIDSEIDDSRPTVIRIHCSQPTMVSVLSGKINTVYDLDEVLIDE